MLDQDNFAINSSSPDQETEDTMKGKYLSFIIDEELYAIPIKNVTEIVSVQPITKMPEVNKCIKGIMNLRGKIIPVMNVRSRFGREEIPFDDKTCIIVIDLENVPIGLIVDQVCEVYQINDDEISPPPAIAVTEEGKFISGIGNKENHISLIVDCHKLLSVQDFEALSNMINA